MSGKKEKLKRKQARDKQKQESLDTGAASILKDEAFSILKLLKNKENAKYVQEALKTK